MAMREAESMEERGMRGTETKGGGQPREQRPGERERVKSESSTPIGKVVEIIGNSPHSFEDAIERAVHTAGKSIRHITGCEVQEMGVVVRDNQVAEYRVDLKLAFGVEHSGEGVGTGVGA